MMKLLIAVLSLLLVTACDARPSGKGMPATAGAMNKQALPVITVSGSEIKINGTTVWLGDTMATWKRALGGAPVCYDSGLIMTCVWHSNGLSLGTDQADKSRVKFMNVDLTIEPPELGERAPSFPQSQFHGTLELDGIPVSANTKFSDLSRQVPSARELRCGGSDCGNPSAAFSEGANIYMSLAGRSESSRILEFSISCSSTEECMALMPNQGKK
jgi:hypothetical protein